MQHIFITLLFCLGFAATALPDEPPPPDQTVILQGDASRCNGAIPAQYRSGACANSVSTSPLYVNTIDGYSECVFIDNSTNNSYFVPFRTKAEWDAFKAAAPNLGLTLRACTPAEEGECGEATEYSYLATASPPTDELCAKGDVADLVKTSSTFSWTCKGKDGGTDKNCQSQRASYCLATPIPPTSTTFSYQVNGGSWQSGSPTVTLSGSNIFLGSGSTTYGFTGHGNTVSNGAGSYTLLWTGNNNSVMGGGGSARNEYVGDGNSINAGGGGSGLYVLRGLNNTAIMDGGGGCNEVHAYGDNAVIAGSRLVIEAHGILRLNSYSRYVYVNGKSGPLTPALNVVIAAP